MSDVDIVNRALQILGSEPIQALNEVKTSARAMTIAYPAVRDAELTRHRWKFSIKRAALAASPTVPSSDFGKQYTVPNDFLRLISGGSLGSYPDCRDFRATSNALYSLEGRSIMTNLGAPLYIRYIARITDTSMYDPAFTESLAARLAEETCERITQSDTKIQICQQRAKRALNEARTANALETASESIQDDTWVAARRSS